MSAAFLMVAAASVTQNCSVFSELIFRPNMMNVVISADMLEQKKKKQQEKSFCVTKVSFHLASTFLVSAL